jgi:tricorn protease-like protein
MRIQRWKAMLLSFLLLTVAGWAQEIDLLDKAPEARWTNLARQSLNFGQDHGEQGSVKYERGMALEDGQSYERVLFIHPPWKKDGAIYGAFDAVTLPEKDPKLVFAMGFNQGAQGTDGVTIEVRFLHAGPRAGAETRRAQATTQLGSASQTIHSLQARYSRQLKQGEVSLSQFAGQTGTFVLIVNAGDTADKDWVAFTELKVVSGTPEAAGASADSSKQVVKNLKGHSGRLYGVRFSPDGKFVVTASADQTARIWEVPSGQLKATLRGHSAHVFGVDFSPNSSRVVTASGDGTAKVWQAGNGSMLLELKGHTKGVLAAAFSPDGNRIATASDDGTVKIWGAGGGNELRSLTIGTVGVYALAFHPNGHLLAVGSGNGGLAIWNTENGNQVRSFTGHKRAVSSVDFTQGGNRLVSASVDNSARIWNANSGNQIHNLGGQAYHSVAVSPNNRYLVAGNDGQATIWSIEDGKRIMMVRHVSATPVRGVDFHMNGRYIVLAGEDGDARIWEINLE